MNQHECYGFGRSVGKASDLCWEADRSTLLSRLLVRPILLLIYPILLLVLLVNPILLLVELLLVEEGER